MTNDLTIGQTTQELVTMTDEQLQKHPVAVYMARLGKSSRRTMLNALHTIAQAVTDDDEVDAWSFQWHLLEYQHTTAIRRWLIDNSTYSKSTINRHLSALRGVLKEYWRLSLMDAETYYRATDIQNVKGETIVKGRMIEDEEIKKLLQVCDLDTARGKSTGLRDAAIIALLWAAGLRRNEIIKLRQTDLNLSTGELQILHGKGNKERVAYVTGTALERVVRWIEHKNHYTKSEALFVSVDQQGIPTENEIQSGQTIYDILTRRGKQAGLDSFSPHDFRRTTISGLLNAGVDVVTVSKIVGHADTTTTAKYDRRDDTAKREATMKRNLPE